MEGVGSGGWRGGGRVTAWEIVEVFVPVHTLCPAVWYCLHPSLWDHTNSSTCVHRQEVTPGLSPPAGKW